MLSKDQIKFIEDNIPFFKSLTENEKKLILSSTMFTKYQKQTILHSGAENCSGLFVVKSGQLRAFIMSSKGKELTVFRLFEYDMCIFSSSCILKNINFDINIEAYSNSEVMIIPSSVFERLMSENIKVLEYTNQLMASRFSDVMWILEQIISLSFDKRLALFLLDQMNIDGSNIISMTHEEIANNLASAREVVTRMLKYFQNEKILNISRNKIEIIDINKLRIISDVE